MRRPLRFTVLAAALLPADFYRAPSAAAITWPRTGFAGLPEITNCAT